MEGEGYRDHYAASAKTRTRTSVSGKDTQGQRAVAAAQRTDVREGNQAYAGNKGRCRFYYH